jgi:S-adenosylmethionine:tRNA ribosyltransferase-isomerase
MDLNQFDYELPKELIAQHAIVPKDHSRLMVLNGDRIEHRHFYDLIDYLNKYDVLVINETKVSKARISGRKATGSPVDIILTRKLSATRYECRIKGNRIHLGDIYLFPDKISCEVIGRANDLFTVEFNKPLSKKLMDKDFELPTPPYVKQKLKSDSEYQTVYSKQEGSLAAPTAGLHFTPALLKKIEAKGVKIAKICLHVDFGTFLPVKGRVEEHHMHEEWFEVTKKAADTINNRKGRLILVGTTSVRTLESAADPHGKIIPQKSKTSIFIYPGYQFKNRIDALITNFHLPKSTLLLLVSAYYGKEAILKAYREAIKQKYRFYSLGDAMLLIK